MQVREIGKFMGVLRRTLGSLRSDVTIHAKPFQLCWLGCYKDCPKTRHCDYMQSMVGRVI
jgi:hypothetical protein